MKNANSGIKRNRAENPVVKAVLILSSSK